MKFLSILALVLSCFVSYGSASFAAPEIPKTVEEAKKLLENSQEALVKAQENHEQIRKANHEKFEKGLLPGGKNNIFKLTEEERIEYQKIADQLRAKQERARTKVVKAEDFVEFRQEELQAFQTDGSLENLHKEKADLRSKMSEIRESLKGISLEDTTDSRELRRLDRKIRRIIDRLSDKIPRGYTKNRMQIALDNAKDDIEDLEDDVEDLEGVEDEVIEGLENILDSIAGKDRNTEAKGANRCATCDDERSPLHTVQVERDENTNPEVAEESRVKKGARGGDSGSR